MKYAKDTRNEPAFSETADVLMEALPWIKNITGKTVVIKYGGSAMVDEQLRADVMSDIVLLKIIGVNPVIIHGGGAAITAAMEKADFPVEFKNGQRVTTEEAMDVVKMVLVGKVNQELVAAMNAHGNLAVGVNGADAGTIIAEQLSPDLGRVGRVTEINATYINDLIKDDYVPLVASVGKEDGGGSLNVNADLVAGEVAAAIGAHKIIFLTDVDGLYENFENKDSLISNMTLFETQYMVENKLVSSGMIPKLTACINALNAGVFRAHIINGTTPHALLLELLTSTGVGTTMHSTEESCTFDAHPLGNLATKLVENRDVAGELFAYVTEAGRRRAKR
ncbi:MAG: acetylglutamate kinase [Raoultibacter sp.]